MAARDIVGAFLLDQSSDQQQHEHVVADLIGRAEHLANQISWLAQLRWIIAVRDLSLVDAPKPDVSVGAGDLPGGQLASLRGHAGARRSSTAKYLLSTIRVTISSSNLQQRDKSDGF